MTATVTAHRSAPRKVLLTGSLVFVAMLWLPMLQQVLRFAPTTKLGGVEDPVPKPDWPTPGTWSAGRWQESFEKKLGHSIGLRDWMVRIDNELRYVLTGTTKRPVVAGRDGWLFEEGYLPGRMLLHVFDRDPLVLNMANLLALQQELERIGITLLVCISPNKVRTYPEQLPFDQRCAEAAASQRPRFCDLAVAAMRVGNVHFLDFGERFRAWRAAAPDGPLLFTRGGVHWSNYGAARAVVDVIDELERITGLDLPSLDLVGTRPAPGPVGDEGDLIDMANVLDGGRFRDPTLQPVLAPRAGDHGVPVPVLFVGTSFVWGLTGHLVSRHVFDPLVVWYYFATEHEVIGNSLVTKGPLDAAKADLLPVLKRFRVIVIEANENSITSLGQGFVDAALTALGRQPFRTVPRGAADLLLPRK